MNHRHDKTIRTAFARTNAETEPHAEPIDDSFWLGGEAMVAPGCFFDLCAEPENADPLWLAI